MDVEKTIEFILGQQAQFSSDIAALDGRLDRLTAQVEHLTQGNQVIAGAVHRLIEHSQAVEKNIAALTEKQQQTTDNLAAMADQQQQTADNLNALIKIVDSMVRGKNGGAH